MPLPRALRPALLLAAALAGCGEPTAPRFELAAARQRWATHGPADYQLTVRRSCECGPDALGPVTVTVRGGVATQRTYTATGAPVDAELGALFPDVPALFALVAEAQARDAAQLAVTYDPALGHPTLVSVDYRAEIADDEFVYTVSALTRE